MLGRWRKRFAGALQKARRQPTEDAIHELRVAARHLRTYCHLIGDDELDHELRWLVHRTAAIRDLDVIAEALGARAVSRERRVAAAQCKRVLGSKRANDIAGALDGLPS